jgi:hypothetical protein
MSPRLPSPLPSFDRNLLRAVASIVPVPEREEWRRSWQAELWHVRHPNRRRAVAARVIADLSLGIFCDALWLRTESWRRLLSGTAIFCLASLLLLDVLSTVMALALNGSWHAMALYLNAPFRRFLVETPLVIFVTFGIASRRYIAQRSSSRKFYWVRRRLFFAAKILLSLLLAFLLSVDVCQPLHAPFPVSSDLLQVFLFTIVALVALRWAFIDQEQRCKQCLRTLSTPARVGRPSHNFLEWNGTELVCKQGHGMLSVPEMESSWCRASRWLEPDWEHATTI